MRAYCRILAFAAGLTILPMEVAAREGIAAARAFGLFGTWAVDCRRPASSENPFMEYIAASEGAIRLLTMNGISRHDLSDFKRLDQERLALRDVKSGQSKEAFDVVLQLREGRLRSWRSVSAKGEVLIDEGAFVGSGRATLEFERCASS